ncbi:hypothetical protein [Blastopirellula retiformator]|uniref:Uncharacterized protein n=1 Tax=Blastopirellula retiformator TaxID=2527970 RepID=A0A5C5VKC4_9BACT|nr:hypothetical protein [Blastopirellula retiformator]TWT38511.1 hypothetical protein Enr8_02040 [Blastopirellula retiformator]
MTTEMSEKWASPIHQAVKETLVAMQFRLSTLGLVVLWFAVLLALGKAGGVESFLMFLNFSGFFLPIFIANVYLRISVSFLMTTFAVDAMLAIIFWTFDQHSTATLVETALELLPRAAIVGLIAVAFSCGVRWLAVLVYRDMVFVRQKRRELAERNQTT